MKYPVLLAVVVLSISVIGSVYATQALTGEHFGIYSVKDFGAKGDGKTDDTLAFQKALDAAGKHGGTVVAPPVAGGKGYVITHTLRIPPSTTLMGSFAGLSTNSWAAFTTPETHVTGAKIFARPLPSQYIGKTKKPLFQMDGGSTIRGFWITYDKQPFPTDEEFNDPASPYYYKSFEEARDNYIHRHVKSYGPTIYIPASSNNVIEDITCDRFYDFFFQAAGAKTYVRRINLYGYNRSFVFAESADINRVSEVHNVPSIGIACPGNVGEGRTFSWIYGIIASQNDNVGIQIGRSDGFVFNDLFFFGLHTAIQLGASLEYPVWDPVKGVSYYYDDTAQKLSGFQMAYSAMGPWGDLTDFAVESCAIGLHLIWPSPQGVKIVNARFSTGIDDGRRFQAVSGTGNTTNIGKQAAIASEASYSIKNNIGIRPTLLVTNMFAASFDISKWFGPAGSGAEKCNGRIFLINSDLTADIAGMMVNYPYRRDLFSARGPDAGKVSIRVRGFIQTGEPSGDIESDGGLLKP